MDESKLIERLEASLHYQNSLVFRDAVEMLKKISGRERYVMAQMMRAYAQKCNWQIIDNGEAEMTLGLFSYVEGAHDD